MPTQVDLEVQAEVAGLLREPVTAFLERNATRESIAALERDELGYSPAHWSDLATIECTRLLMPESWSGTPHGVQVMAPVVELLGEHALPTPLFATAVDAAGLIARAGSQASQDALLPPIASGEEIVVVALHESSAGPAEAPGDLRTTAEAVDGGWRLRGAKVYVPYANAAARILCVANVGDDQLGIFVVPAEAPGLSTTRLRTTNGDPLFTLALDDVVVAGDALIGEPQDAWPAIVTMADIGAAFKSAELLGIGRRVLALTREVAHARVQFGQPIGAFQAVQHHVADMYRLIEQTRVLTEQAILRLDNGHPAAREVSLAKIKASEGLVDVLNLAQQIHGGVGYYDDYPLEVYFRRTMAAQGAYGSARWHRRRLGDLLLQSPDRFRRHGAHPLALTADR
jgi:alkylation response protein AidB-like acyl-CoA dehydrogenase